MQHNTRRWRLCAGSPPTMNDLSQPNVSTYPPVGRGQQQYAMGVLLSTMTHQTTCSKVQTALFLLSQPYGVCRDDDGCFYENRTDKHAFNVVADLEICHNDNPTHAVLVQVQVGNEEKLRRFANAQGVRLSVLISQSTATSNLNFETAKWRFHIWSVSGSSLKSLGRTRASFRVWRLERTPCCESRRVQRTSSLKCESSLGRDSNVLYCGPRF